MSSAKPAHTVLASSEPAAVEFFLVVAVCLCLLAEWLFGFYSRGLTLLKHLTAHWFEFLLAAQLGLAAPRAILFFICFGVTNCDSSTAARLKPS